MKSVIKLLFLFVVFTSVLTACSKEQKIENKLVRGSGKWNIRKLNKSSNSNYIGEYLDAGSFEFHKDRTIVKILNLWPKTTTETGAWINDEDKITVTWSDGKTTVFYITRDPKKDKMTLYETYTVTTFTGWGGPGSHTTTKYVYDYYLERAH